MTKSGPNVTIIQRFTIKSSRNTYDVWRVCSFAQSPYQLLYYQYYCPIWLLDNLWCFQTSIVLHRPTSADARLLRGYPRYAGKYWQQAKLLWKTSMCRRRPMPTDAQQWSLNLPLPSQWPIFKKKKWKLSHNFWDTPFHLKLVLWKSNVLALLA